MLLADVVFVCVSVGCMLGMVFAAWYTAWKCVLWRQPLLRKIYREVYTSGEQSQKLTEARRRRAARRIFRRRQLAERRQLQQQQQQKNLGM